MGQDKVKVNRDNGTLIRGYDLDRHQHKHQHKHKDRGKGKDKDKDNRGNGILIRRYDSHNCIGIYRARST